MNYGLRRSLSLVAMVLLLTVILAACGTSSDEVEPTVTREDVAGAPPTRTPTVAGAATPGTSAAATPAGGEAPATGGDTALGTTFDVDMVDMAYNPTELTIPADTDVTINLTNSGALEHTFDISDVVSSGAIPGGGSGSVTVNLPAGTYEYWCSIPGHKEAGMVGTLTVAEGGAAAPASGSPTTGTAEPPAAGSPAAEASPAEASPAADLQTSFEVDMVDIAFNPAELTIPANVDVTINLTNSGVLEHTFDVGEVGSGVIPGGGTGSVTLNLPPGTYEYICAIPGHKEAGMVGTLIVEDAGAAVSGDEPSDAPAADASPEAPAAAALPTTFDVDMVDIAFNPTELTIPADTDVTINLTNSGVLEHTFDVEGFASSGVIPGGGTGTVTLNLPAGTYEYVCVIPGHKEAGMLGTLTVVDSGAAASPEASPAASPGASPAAALPTTYDVDMVDIAFEPTELTIPANVDVTINLTNSGVLEHTFDVGEVTSGTIAGGGTGSVTLNLAPGTYDFICAIPGHKEAGMVGTLTVVGDATQTAAAPSEPVSVDMVELVFKPDNFEIAANTDVTINLTNSGLLPHNFSIPSEDISVDLAAGDSTTFVLNLPPGTYDFDCNVPGHADAGMVGKLTVK